MHRFRSVWVQSHFPAYIYYAFSLSTWIKTALNARIHIHGSWSAQIATCTAAHDTTRTTPGLSIAVRYQISWRCCNLQYFLICLLLSAVRLSPFAKIVLSSNTLLFLPCLFIFTFFVLSIECSRIFYLQHNRKISPVSQLFQLFYCFFAISLEGNLNISIRFYLKSKIFSGKPPQANLKSPFAELFLVYCLHFRLLKSAFNFYYFSSLLKIIIIYLPILNYLFVLKSFILLNNPLC